MRGGWMPALAGLALILAGGCASSVEQENEAAGRGATKAFEAYARALREGDCPAAYALLSPNLRRRATPEEFRGHYMANREHYLQMAASKVEKTLYDDFRVALKVTDGAGVLEWVFMVPENGGWRVDDAGRDLAELCRRLPSGRP